MKHWAKHLSEAGRPIFDKASKIENLHADIADMERRIKAKKHDIEIAEHDLLREVEQVWTTAQIEQARDAAAGI